MKQEWEKQKELKFRDHDIALEDIPELDFLQMKSTSIKTFVETRESCQVKIITSAFMGYLTSKGYRIIKKEE